MRLLLLALLSISFISPASRATEPTAAERGKKALLGTSFIAASWRETVYANAWKYWDGKYTEKPADYDAKFRERYGLHPAPYPNDGLPMGLRKASILFIRGFASDCMLCHGGSIMGKSYVGLGNTALDVQALFEELSAADGRSPKLPFTFSNVRGTSEAGGMAVFLLGYREPDLTLRKPSLNLGLHDDLCEDVPAWWLLKKKKTMYHTGGSDARSVRSKMQFMMTPLTTPADFERHEAAFQDIQQYLLSLQPPKYPFPIDKDLAARGEKVFDNNCAKCHGTYGENWTYPNKIIPVAEIGTDRKRFDGITEAFGKYYDQTWFAKETKDGYRVCPTKGYQAPPLDGLWATAPYFHNGSVPTVYQVLKSSARPALYTRSFKTEANDFDYAKLGWKYTKLQSPPSDKLPASEFRKVYDTSKPGRGNGGHTYGDDLTEEERMAVIEYLKTL
jgi:hypothetical protein